MKKGITLLLCLLIAGMLFAGGNSQTTTTATAARGAQEMVINNGTEIQSLDPSLITGVPEHRVYMALFEGLVGYDPRTAKAVPGVAESWRFNSTNDLITFTLRANAVWSDGTPITAQTMVDSWLRTLDPNTASEYAYLIGMVVKGADDYNTGVGRRQDVGIRAVNDRTFEVTLVGPAPYALDMMAHYAFSPLPMHVINRAGSSWTQAANFVGNGPYILQERIPNNRTVVVPNDKYWNKANVFLTKITFLPIDDDNTAHNAYLNGEIDWVPTIPLSRIDEIKLRKDFQTSVQLGTYYILVNQYSSHAALKDARVRKAISMAINRQELIDNVLKAGQKPALTLSPPMAGYEPPTGNAFNVTEAKRLLAEAGYPNGQGLPTLEYVYNTNEGHRIIGEYLQQALRNNLGININLVNMEWATYLDYRSTGPFQLARAGWIADYQDPQNFLELLISNTGNNDGKYSNPEYDALIRRFSAMPDGPQRAALMRQAEQIGIVDDQALIPLYFYVSQHMIDLTKWEGWHANAMDVHPYVGLKRR